jgi:hypothetical protein
MSDDNFEKLKSLLTSETDEVHTENYVKIDNYSPPSPAKRRPQEGPESPFTVYIDDNYHYQDEDERYIGGEFGTWKAAVTFARKVVDRTVVPTIEGGGGLSPEEAYDNYIMFGDDPWITGRGPIPEGETFSAWPYAKQRCYELYEQKKKKENEEDRQDSSAVWNKMMKSELMAAIVHEAMDEGRVSQGNRAKQLVRKLAAKDRRAEANRLLRRSTGKTLEKAIMIATEAHKSQTDKAGNPYILHPLGGNG